jgi:hypothetical protein
MNCKICGSHSRAIHRATILNKYEIQYFQCPECDFVQTEEPYWIEEAYSEALSVSDTGVMIRNNQSAEFAAFVLASTVGRKTSFLDYGGGYGIFTRLMRDKGFNFYWYDKYATNLMARGFEGAIEGISYSAVTSFENFEHFVEPIEDIERIFGLTDFVLFSTSLVPSVAPKPSDWWYYCLEHGQHVSIFSRKSLEYIANKYGYFLTTNGTNLHVFAKKKVSKNIFLVHRLIAKLGLGTFFEGPSKTNQDMDDMIGKMKKL